MNGRFYPERRLRHGLPYRKKLRDRCASTHLVRDPDSYLLPDMARAMVSQGDYETQRGLLIGFWEAIQHFAVQSAKAYGTAPYRARFEALEDEYDRRHAAEVAENEAAGSGGES